MLFHWGLIRKMNAMNMEYNVLRKMYLKLRFSPDDAEDSDSSVSDLSWYMWYTYMQIEIHSPCHMVCYKCIKDVVWMDMCAWRKCCPRQDLAHRVLGMRNPKNHVLGWLGNGILSTARARKTLETPFTMRNRSDHDPRMIRPHTKPSRTRRTAEVDHRGSGTDFV